LKRPDSEKQKKAVSSDFIFIRFHGFSHLFSGQGVALMRQEDWVEQKRLRLFGGARLGAP
jgi:hypothetical protein